MSLHVTGEVWDNAPVDGGALLVLLALADNADRTTREAWPSVADMARRARLDRRHVQRVLRDLEAAGCVEVVRRGGGRNRPTVYRVTPAESWKTEGRHSAAVSPAGNGDAGAAVSVTNGQPETATFDAQRATFDGERATPAPPEPLLEPSLEATDGKGALSRADDEQVLDLNLEHEQAGAEVLTLVPVEVLEAEVHDEATRQHVPALVEPRFDADGFPARTWGIESLTQTVVRWAEAQGVPTRSVTRREDVHAAALDLVYERLHEVSPTRYRVFAAQVVQELVEDATGERLATGGPTKHLHRLLSLYGAHTTLRLVAQAIEAGAGLDPEHENDPLALLKYAAAIGRGAGTRGKAQ